jgi:flagellar biosynthesis/type III secretory pathway protein FliH
MIGKAAGLVVELNEDEAERMRADNRMYFLMDQAGIFREREARGRAQGLAEGRQEAEEKYRPIIEENQAIKRELEDLRRKLREAGMDSA